MLKFQGVLGNIWGRIWLELVPSPLVRLWDLPGAGTAAVPAESYLQEHKRGELNERPSTELSLHFYKSWRTWGFGTLMKLLW